MSGASGIRSAAHPRARERSNGAEAAGTVSADRKRRKTVFPNDARQDIHDRGEQPGAGNENDPAFEQMQESVGVLRPEMIDHHADQADAKAVHRDRDRDGRQEHQRSLPKRRLEQVGRKETQAHQRIEIAQAAARLDHLELVHAEVDDVAFEKDRDLEQPDEEDAELRREELKLERKSGVDDIGQGDRKKQERDGQERDLQQRHAADREHDADEREDEAELRHQHQRAQLADDVQERRQQDDQRPDPRRLADICPQRVAPRPQQPCRDDGDQKSVAVFFLDGPAPQQLPEPAAKSDARPQGARRQQAGRDKSRPLALISLGPRDRPSSTCLRYACFTPRPCLHVQSKKVNPFRRNSRLTGARHRCEAHPPPLFL